MIGYKAWIEDTDGKEIEEMVLMKAIRKVPALNAAYVARLHLKRPLDGTQHRNS
jgi:hypothetical protein